MQWSAIIPAAGQGSRFGSSPKQYLEIAGKPLLYYTLRLFEQSQRFAKIILVVDAAHLAMVRTSFLKPLKLGETTPIEIVEGGSSRAESVLAGLRQAKGSSYVAIHDGARPCLSQNLLQRLLKKTEENGAVVPGLPLYDSIKRVESGVISQTVDRQALWAVQTPQCFRYDWILDGYEKAVAAGVIGFDDAEMVERLGVKVHIERGEIANLKVTYPEDLERCQDLLGVSLV